ncbi:hypothetical protein HDV64DRAFT_138675 [Trichoderma sp. TUCIM 5745]
MINCWQHDWMSCKYSALITTVISVLVRHKADTTYIQHTSTSTNDEAFQVYLLVILLCLFFFVRNILHPPLELSSVLSLSMCEGSLVFCFFYWFVL